MAQSKQAKPAEAAAMNAVYEKLSNLMGTLRDAQIRIHHPELLAVVNDLIDRQLESDELLRRAILEHTGRPVQDPY
ncbi:MAG: hypothetical protein HY332_12045 [Chloroflexi bacterium]|nr:hypothetical protein [Chloroflexota bacterium]